MVALSNSPGLKEWRTLGPSHLTSHRQTRYEAENERRWLKDFEEEDQKLLTGSYRVLLHLFHKLKPFYQDSEASRQILEQFFENGEETELEEKIISFGKATLARPHGSDCSRVIHDLRGGSFQALILRMAIFHSSSPTARSIQNIFFLLRDHLKIMRTCVADLDPERFADDGKKQDHQVSLLVEKWSVADFGTSEKPIKIMLECLYEGTICESCLEFSTLDRIIYNLMTNAAHHTTDGLIHFGLFPVPTEKPENLRIVIANTVLPEHQAVLIKAFPNDLTELFKGGFSTGGHGLGTRICADFCAQAYGIEHFSDAKAGGHFGAKMIENYFVAWFHWPIKTHS